jgi:hypothetical protein
MEESLSLPHLRYYTGIFLEGLMKTAKILSHDSQSSDRDLNPVPPEAPLPITWLQNSVTWSRMETH